MNKHMDITNKIIGVIGYGNFGKVVCDYLFPKHTIILYSSKKINKSSRIILAHSLSELVEKADIIIPAVPIREFEKVMQQIKSLINEEKIVMDICSVKEYPVAIMKKYLPDVQYIATHPMFGPNSIKRNNNSMNGFSIAVCKTKINKNIFESYVEYFKDLQLTVTIMSPEEHDKSAAYSQFFSLTVGQIARELAIKPTSIDTPGAVAMMQALTYVGQDRMIIEDMVTYNIYCKSILEHMKNTINRLETKR